VKGDNVASTGAEAASVKPYYSHCFCCADAFGRSHLLAGLSCFWHIKISFTFGPIIPSSFRLMQCLPSSLYVSYLRWQRCLIAVLPTSQRRVITLRFLSWTKDVTASLRLAINLILDSVQTDEFVVKLCRTCLDSALH
jgi:hypothetical protein